MVTVWDVGLAVVTSLLLFGAGYGYRGLRARDRSAGPVESYLDDRRQQLRERYATGEISRAQFAAEIETVEDPSTERIMHLARDVDGVGPHIAFTIAREFDDVEDLAESDRETLERINRVGENRAHAVLQRARQEQ